MAKIDDYASAFLASHLEFDAVNLFSYREDDGLARRIFDRTGIEIGGKGKNPLDLLYRPSNEEAKTFFEGKPNQNVLIIADASFDAFSAWEIGREYVTYLCIAVDESDIRRVVSEWKGEKEDVELSVVFPVYNVEKYIEQCIQTVTEWDAKFLEFIFVDDGSSDHSVEIIEKYARLDPRIRLIRKENGGCASARNAGLSAAKGRYVGFIDPDDFIDPTMFRKLLAKAISGTVDIVWCNFNEYYNNTGLSSPAEDLDPTPFLTPVYDRDTIMQFIAIRRIAIWRAIYKRDMLLSNGIAFNEKLRRFDDLPFKVQTFALAKSIAAVNENLYYYRLDREGQDVSANDERLYVHFEIFASLDDFFRKLDNKEMTRLYEIVKFDTHAWALSKLKPEFVPDYLAKAKRDLLSMLSKREVILLARNKYHKKGARIVKKILRS